MRFLFIAPGYPDVVGTGSGSGIGTYVRELTLGLAHGGHECHIVVWANTQSSASGGTTRVADGITVHTLAHSYWPVIERLAPDSRDAHNLRVMVRKLHEKWRFDWIEIESEEGIGIGIQRDFPAKTILRVHTTLDQMVEHKDVTRTFAVRRRLARENRSFQMAGRVSVPSPYHRDQLQSMYPFIEHICVVPNGVDLTSPPDVKDMASGPEPHSEVSTPAFLIVGNPDRRKGFDRIVPILSCYARKYGGCTAVIVSSCSDEKKREFGLLAPDTDGAAIVWRKEITGAELLQEYSRASTLLHVARYESFGLPLIEAAALGTPVVATPTGIAPELLEGELARFLINGDDAEMCATALHAAVTQRSYAGRILRIRYQQHFTRAKMVEAFLDDLLPRAETQRNTSIHEFPRMGDLPTS